MCAIAACIVYNDSSQSRPRPIHWENEVSQISYTILNTCKRICENTAGSQYTCTLFQIGPKPIPEAAGRGAALKHVRNDCRAAKRQVHSDCMAESVVNINYINLVKY